MNEDFLIIKNPDAEFRSELVRRIKANGGYCPSKFERTADTKCHCKDYRQNCNCECGLFIRILCIDVTEV